MNKMFTKPYDAGAAVKSNRFVKFGADDDKVVQAAASTDLIIGAVNKVAPPGSDAATGDRLDVEHYGIVDIRLGGTVTRGSKLTADSDGRAIAAAPGAGTNAQIGGIALQSGVVDDIVPVLLTIAAVQG